MVGISDCKVSRDADSVLITYALGSCIAVALYDPVAKVGGLLHYMLPESAIDAAKAERNPFMFADTGIPHMIEAVRAARRRAAAHDGAAGRRRAGMDSQGVFQIGKRNYLAARRILWKTGMLIAAEAVGGEVSRTPRLEIATGRMWVREGGGIERELPAAPRTTEESYRKGGDAMPYSVLIVDDSPVMRSFIRRVMRLSGFEVGECLEASNGEEALAQLKEHGVDVILTDINMPKMNGEELLRELEASGV